MRDECGAVFLGGINIYYNGQGFTCKNCILSDVSILIFEFIFDFRKQVFFFFVRVRNIFIITFNSYFNMSTYNFLERQQEFNFYTVETINDCVLKVADAPVSF